jgi:hypothetical protein
LSGLFAVWALENPVRGGLITGHRVNAIAPRLAQQKPVFTGARRSLENILNKLHLNQHIADFSYMMRPTPKVKGD